MEKIMVIAPHPADETLGCGGTLLRFRREGCCLAWLIVTDMTAEVGFKPEQIARRDAEIKKVGKTYGFDVVYRLGFAATSLDAVPVANLSRAIGKAVAAFQPHTLLVSFGNDNHTDHQVVFKASASCFKWFRFPSVKKVLAYETLSETDQAVASKRNVFSPNVFVDISKDISKKIAVMRIYKSEFEKFPFPRSEKAIRSLAAVRGAASGHDAAEAFMLIKETI